MASHSRNENGDFEQTLLNEGVSQSTLERLRKEAITDWSTLTILTPEDISELGLPVGQKAIVRKLIQRKPPDNNGQTTRGLQVRSNFHDKEREAVLSETATEYAGANTFSRDNDDEEDYEDAFTVATQDDIYDDAISLDQQMAQKSPVKVLPPQTDDVPPEKPPRLPRGSSHRRKSEQRSKKNSGKTPVPLPQATEEHGDIYDVPEEEDLDNGNQDDLYDVPDMTDDGGDIYDESSLDSPPQIKSAARSTEKPQPKSVTKASMTSGSERNPRSTMTEPKLGPRTHITSGSKRASRSQTTSESTRVPKSDFASESTRAPKAGVTSESVHPSPAVITPEAIQLPKAAGTSHMSKLLSMSGDLKNAAKHIMKFDTKPAVRPTIVKVDSSPMTETESIPDSRPSKPRLSSGFPSDSGTFNKTTTNELPPRKSREQRSPHGVHFPEDMLAPDPDDDMYEAPVATNGKHSVMNVRHNSIPDEEAPDVPLRQRSKPKTQRSLSEGETTMRVVKIKEDNTGDHEVELNVSCLETDGKGKIILELTTAHQDVVKPLPARILLLVDTSGSMGIKVGRTRRSKLNRLKAFVMSMVKILDDGDQAALVTFGEDTKVLLPMSEINDRTQDTLTRQLDELDKTFLSQKTDLSAGLITSLDVFGRVCKSQNDLLSYRNSIIVFSDGEINMGTQEPQRLVHEVREKIRSMSFGLDNTQNQWVSISTVVTGSSPSEIMYSLSKFCSSDAFYHLDTDKSSKSDVDLFLPIMMRKTAIAWNVSLHVASLNGATIINADCTQENKVRLRGHKMAEGEKTEKAYFFYDIQAASEKHVGIVIDLSGVSENPDVVVLTATIHFTGVSGKRRYVTRDVTLGDLTTNDQSKKKEALEDIYMHEARILSQIAVSKAAEELKTGRAEKSRTRLIEGQTDLQRLMESYGQMAEVEEVKIDITPHAESVIKNLQSLLDAIESATGNDEDVNGKNWIRMKAVSSAITREAPTTSDTVADNDILCPLPKVRQVSSENIREQMVHVYRKQGVRNSSFINMDHTMKELSASLRMRPISE